MSDKLTKADAEKRIIETGTTFLVQSQDGNLYQASKEPVRGRFEFVNKADGSAGTQEVQDECHQLLIVARKVKKPKKEKEQEKREYSPPRDFDGPATYKYNRALRKVTGYGCWDHEKQEATMTNGEVWEILRCFDGFGTDDELEGAKELLEEKGVKDRPDRKEWDGVVRNPDERVRFRGPVSRLLYRELKVLMGDEYQVRTPYKLTNQQASDFIERLKKGDKTAVAELEAMKAEEQEASAKRKAEVNERKAEKAAAKRKPDFEVGLIRQRLVAHRSETYRDDLSKATGSFKLPITVATEVVSAFPPQTRLTAIAALSGVTGYADLARDLGLSNNTVQGHFTEMRAAV